VLPSIAVAWGFAPATTAAEVAMKATRKTNGVDHAQPVRAIDSSTTESTVDDWSRTLLIVSDIRFFREGLAEALADEDAFAIVGFAADLGAAREIAAAKRPQVILLDAAFPDGLVAARNLRELNPQTSVVALALQETEDDVIAWAEAGIAGYLPRTAGMADLVGFLRDVVRGEQTCSARVTAGLLRWISSASRASTSARARTSNVSSLTPREAQVVRLLCAGLSNKEISRRLNIGLATTKSHVHNLLAKLELERRGQVVRWSHQHAETLREEP
jgi:two-component system, NarL family, nitrate/nitrite response regulator NarL